MLHIEHDLGLDIPAGILLLILNFGILLLTFAILSIFKQQKMKLALVGATGLVGQEMLKILDQRNFEFDELLLVASERSVGKILEF